ncbi:MAG: hypothetical protein A2086_17010 [Spirochaetes bacterium GWD1_27_9]|nr:MAG: hypothetical protein A2Z98_15335 [Spirochaetes bacterium GWB1_27_13]OHD27656.1 MAG: hypothetical protein A2Y34_10690 [Spirochaetes bacterium GWC1_27_15]OHD33330.1 MAG: hypothetical protein A2086_17010 [Spirochaetes bacterium GWD1_27_9]
MRKIWVLKSLLKFENFILFLFFFLFPLFSVYFFSFLVEFLYKNFDLIKLKLYFNDTLSFLTIQYFVFFLLFYILFYFSKVKISFIKQQNWFYTLGEALFPATFAFATGFLVTVLFVVAGDILPIPAFIKDWIKMPNSGFVEIFNNLRGQNHFKVILWFLYIVALAPIIEEILFRGFLQEFFAKLFKKTNFDIYLTALIFGAFHFSSLSNVVFAIVIGYFLSKERKLKNSINISIWIHCIINFTGLLYGIIMEFGKQTN